MSTTQATNPPTRTYRVEVTEQNTVPLPDDLSHALDLAVGDVVELRLEGEHVVLRRVSEASPPDVRGLLSDYFTDREDVQRFIDEERRG
jgi:bifunctional DNA-binding transcriptional regulator/antitoxin component of YhaV-PrlF toxin-antitoxin module